MSVVSINEIQNAFLIFINIDSLNKKNNLENAFDEFKSLVISSGLTIRGSKCLKQPSPVINTFISKGNLNEARDEILKNDIEIIIINHELSASQTRNLEKFFNIRVIDKTELILDIFATRATSHIGKLQVELAQLKHLSSRLIRGWTHLERQKGGIGLRGPGETQLETDRRLINKRIKRLTMRLDKSHKQREINRYSRKKSRNKLVALVGYTNAGKTTLFNKLTDSSKLAEDKLFATLDSVTRKNINPKYGPILFSDTVGFISNLPTQLIQSFKATLDELKTADLLLHVVDANDHDYKSKMHEVNKILTDIGVMDVPQIIVNNKCDLINKTKLDILKFKKNNEAFISAESDKEFHDLRLKIDEILFNGTYQGWISMENNLGYIRSTLFDMGCVRDEKIDNSGKMFIKIKIGNDELDEFLDLKGFELCCDEDILTRII